MTQKDLLSIKPKLPPRKRFDKALAIGEQFAANHVSDPIALEARKKKKEELLEKFEPGSASDDAIRELSKLQFDIDFMPRIMERNHKKAQAYFDGEMREAFEEFRSGVRAALLEAAEARRLAIAKAIEPVMAADDYELEPRVSGDLVDRVHLRVARQSHHVRKLQDLAEEIERLSWPQSAEQSVRWPVMYNETAKALLEIAGRSANI
jgi:hypothetical protein